MFHTFSQDLLGMTVIFLGLAAIDAKVLAFLYGYLSPGDTEQDARALFERHWGELDRVLAAQ